jgi:hypothetical protein
MALINGLIQPNAGRFWPTDQHNNHSIRPKESNVINLSFVYSLVEKLGFTMLSPY